jgi:hypothetical protein
VTVVCDVHGPMKWREPVGWWECLGFDGEGPRECGVMITYEEDVRAVLRSGSGFPGVTIVVLRGRAGE